MKRRKPLRRKAAFKSTWGALKRTRLKPVSKKRQREGAVYAAKRKAFLAAHPYCQAYLKSEIMPLDYTMGQAEVLARKDIVQCPLATEVHHVFGRGRYYLDESSWLAVSAEWHRKIHQNPKWAREVGLLA